MTPANKKKLDAALDSLFSTRHPHEKKNGDGNAPGLPAAVVEAAAPAAPVVLEPVKIQGASSGEAVAELPKNPEPFTPPVIKPVLPARPEAAPQPSATPVAAKGNRDTQLVIFGLNGQSYGVNIALVESIIKMQTITPLPNNSRQHIKGITNLRGRVLPVIDLRTRFNLPKDENSNNKSIIVITINQSEVGIIAEGVSEVLTVHETNIESAPTLTTTIESSYITGIAKIDQRLIILLDMEKVLFIR